MWIVLTAALAMFCATFLRGFQNKNVAAGYKKLSFMCGAIMAGLDGLVVVSLAHSGLSVIPATAFGAGLGWVAGMVAHDRLMRRVVKAAKKKKRIRREQQIDETIDLRMRHKLEELGFWDFDLINSFRM
jgi:hypothetical protein